MSGSCPVSARVCQETARERDELSRALDNACGRVLALTRERGELAAEVVNLRNHVRALTEDVARADTLATILDGAREGLARSGSRAKGVRDVQALLTASAVREGVQGARRRVLSTRRREDRGRAASKALGLLRERDAARAEVERLRAGIEALTYALGPGLPTTDRRVWDATRSASEMAHDLLNPTKEDS